MKIIFYVIILACIAMTACSNFGYEDEKNIPELQFSNPLAYVGNIHNDALTAIAKEHISQDSICSFSYSYVDEQFSGYHIPMFQFNDCTKKSLDIAMRIGYENTVSYQSRGCCESETADSIYHVMPENCKPFVDKMKAIVNSNETDSTVIANWFRELDLSIHTSDLSTEDKNCMWACSAITYSSYMYNLPKITSRAVTAAGVVKADMEAACASFLCWKFWGVTASGLMFGPEGAVIAATKEIIRGAVVGSGMSIIFSL